MATCFSTKVDDEIGEGVGNKILLKGQFTKNFCKSGKMTREASLNLFQTLRTSITSRDGVSYLL